MQRWMIINKNALGSGEFRLLGDKFYCQLLFRLEYKTSVKRKNCKEIQENLLHIDILQSGELFQGFYTQKTDH